MRRCVALALMLLPLGAVVRADDTPCDGPISYCSDTSAAGCGNCNNTCNGGNAAYGCCNLSDCCCTNSCCNDGCCLDNCCCCEIPTWVVRAGYVYMHRSRPRNAPLIDNAAGATVLNANQYNFGFQSGVDAGICRNLSCDWGLDARYFWISDYVANPAPVTTGAGSAIGTTPITVLGPAFTATTQYRSALQTAEISLRRNYGCIGLLAGFRFAELNERLQGTLVAAPGGPAPASLAWNSRNHLYGFQLGADAVCWQSRGGFRIDGFAKAGIYGNAANSLVQATFPPLAPYNSAASSGQVSFLGELGLLGVYPVSDHIALRGGYQLMWLTGVALASDQVASTGNFFAAPASTINTTGSIFYHGLNAGLEFTW